MASSNSVTLTFAGDSTSLDRSVKTVNTGLDSVKTHSEHAAGGIENVSEHVEGSIKHFRGGKDALDGLTTGLGAVGVAIPGPIGGIMTMAGGLADLADGLATTVLPAVKGLWAVMAANPLVATIAVVALLGAGFVLLYKKSQTFRDIVNGVWHSIRDGAAAVIGFFSGAWGAISGLIKTPFEAAFNAVKSIWNSTIGGFGIPSIHILGFSTPGFTIPRMANGGRSPGGTTLVGERGPELVNLPAGSMVTPNGRGGSGSTSATTVLVDFTGLGGDPLIEALRKAIRVRGSNVQAVLGQGA